MTDRRDRPLEPKGSRRLGVAGGIAILVLAGFLVGALLYAAHGWNALAGVAIPPVGRLILVLGSIVTVVVGAGLMALLFYSSRKGKDF